MTQLSIHDALSGATRKAAGQARMEQIDPFVLRMREVAKAISLESGFVSADNLRVYADKLGWAPIHNASWGAIFRGPQWREIGRQKSAVPSNHNREIRVWRWEA